MKSLFYSVGVAVAGTLFCLPLQAQNILPKNAVPMIVTSHGRTVSSDGRTINLNVEANVDYAFSSDADWCHLRKSANGVYATVEPNYVGDSRVANLVFSNEEKGISQTLVLTQRAFEPTAVEDNNVYVKPTNVTANNSFSGNPASLTIDGDYGTFWHSNYSGASPSPAVSEDTPATLEYTFQNVDYIDQINYVPRQDGQDNGYFQTVKLWVKTGTATEYTLYNTYNWTSSSATKKISFEGGLQNPKAIKFEVTKGSNNFASCAEMQFVQLDENSTNDYDIFADDMYTTLKPGFTEADFENLTDPIVKSLAYQIMHNTYSTEYRVASYVCHNSPQYYSNLWAAPGKYYDQLAGVTGINIKKGKHVILVRDLPEGMIAELRIVAWFAQELGSNGIGGGPAQASFSLNNGLNIIDYTNNFPGLAYIAYYDENGNSAAQPPLRVHFINGEVNGYLSLDKTNAQMHEITANAKNTCMDVVGNKVHSIWTSNGLHDYCKAIDGSIGYRQYMNVIDSLIQWEHDLLGFTKYNHIPDLRTMAYVNYTYYMFQGGYGVSFMYDQERRVLNCNTLVNNDEDAIWGLSHEWGHQHQMQPYFCWAGMSEVTNNMNSYYNIMRMGYRNSRDTRTFANAADYFMNDNIPTPGPNDGFNYTVKSDGSRPATHRKLAYDYRSEVSYNSTLYALATSMSDSLIHDYADNPARALAHQDVGPDHTLTAFVKLYCYFRDNGKPDFAQDWYEALRQSDNENGSTIEKQSGLDKYELLNKAQNSDSEAWTKFKADYPNSVWTTQNLVSPAKGWYANSVPALLNWVRKVSRLSGYNLFPYFDRWGFLRQIAMRVGDYGNKWYLMTPGMYEEFKADMEALVTSGELQTMPDGMVEQISTAPDRYFSKPTFPN